MHKNGAQILGTLILGVCCAGASFADTIVDLSANETMSPGTPVDTLELIDLGIDPGSFLFTGNTMYDYTGTYELEIIAAQIDPAITTSLAGLSIQQILVIFGDSGSASAALESAVQQDASQDLPPAVPEPATEALCLAGCLVVYGVVRGVRGIELRTVPPRAG